MNEARINLATALRDMAETNLLRGEALPLPDDRRTDPDADLEKPIFLLLQVGQQLAQQVTVPAQAIINSVVQSFHKMRLPAYCSAF